jgi:DnaJ-class molecular chaperone
VIFDVVEEPHSFFERKGNDLYGTLVLSSQDAREGCIKRITALDPSEDPITIVIPPHKYSYEQQLRQRQREKERLRTKKEKTTPVSRKSKNSSHETNDDEEYDRLIKIPGRGWPTGNADLKGDVILSVRVKKPRRALHKEKLS